MRGIRHSPADRTVSDLRSRGERQAETAALQQRTDLKNKLRIPNQTDLRPMPAEGLLPLRHGVQNALLSRYADDQQLKILPPRC